MHNQPRVSGLLNEDSNESRELQDSGGQETSAESKKISRQQGLVSTIKASEMLQEVSHGTVASVHTKAQSPEPNLPARLARLEALLEMMLAKVPGIDMDQIFTCSFIADFLLLVQSDILELNQAKLGKSVAEIQRNTGSSKTLVETNSERNHQLATRAALQRVFASANKVRQLPLSGQQCFGSMC